MKITSDFSCPCGSGNMYSECCMPYHKGNNIPSAENLARARYSAYALNLVPFLLKTTHPDNPGFIPHQSEWEEELLQFCERTKFESFRILETKEDNHHAYITYEVHFSQDGKTQSFIEKGHFKKENEKWLYLDGIAL